jgi:hypothetical protein
MTAGFGRMLVHFSETSAAREIRIAAGASNSFWAPPVSRHSVLAQVRAR